MSTNAVSGFNNAVSPERDRKGQRHVQTTIRYFDDPGVPLSPRIIGG